MIQITIRSYLVAEDENIEDKTLLSAEKVDELQTTSAYDAAVFYNKYLGTHRVMMKVWDDDPEVNNARTNRDIADAIMRIKVNNDHIQ